MSMKSLENFAATLQSEKVASQVFAIIKNGDFS